MRTDTAVHAVAPLERHERLGMPRTQPVEMRARLPAQVQEVLEACVADVRGARAAALEQRVRGRRRPVREPLMSSAPTARAAATTDSS